MCDISGVTSSLTRNISLSYVSDADANWKFRLSITQLVRAHQCTHYAFRLLNEPFLDEWIGDFTGLAITAVPVAEITTTPA